MVPHTNPKPDDIPAVNRILIEEFREGFDAAQASNLAAS